MNPTGANGTQLDSMGGGFQNPINGAYYASGSGINGQYGSVGGGSSSSVGGATGTGSSPAGSTTSGSSSGQTGTTGLPFIDPNDPSSVTAGANAAIQSSAPPYQPLTGDPSTSGTAANSALTQEEQNAFNPSLPANEQFTYTPIQNQPGDTLTTTNQAITQQPDTAQATAAQTGPITATPASQYTADTISGAQGTVDPNSLVQNQMTDVMNSNLNDNGIPDWAQNAVTASNQRMAQLGLGSSTMAANAETSAILQTALPMAMQNAQVYAQLNSQNLSNSQAALLSNQAAVNASQQFNAQSQQQNDQFFANLSATMASQNADRETAVSQFNAGQVNSANQFFDNLDSAQQEFNIQNQRIVDQSNVQWQRTINTANTAGENAANQANVQNLFNMNQTALNNVWQQARDEASWSLTSSENSQNRALSFVNSALNRQTSLDILSSQMQAQLYSQLGSLGVNLLSGLLGSGTGAAGLGAGIASLFKSGNSSSAYGSNSSTYTNDNYTSNASSGNYSVTSSYS